MKSFNLETLAPEDSQDLLNYLCPRAGFAAGEIAKLCNHLPLAIILAGHFLAANQKTDSSTYLENLREERKKTNWVTKKV